MWNDFFYYRRAERIAIVILLAAIGISLFVARFFTNRQSDELLLLQTDSIFISACDSFFLTLTKEQASYRY
ncbi:MAG: helix-hairpin-helix domain-containing protein, partial [Bacteroidales bacterium]